jgi:hypothetical protein
MPAGKMAAGFLSHDCPQQGALALIYGNIAQPTHARKRNETKSADHRQY